MKKVLMYSFALLLTFAYANSGYSQGVTTSNISGKVTTDAGESLPGALVLATHTPSGTKYSTVTNNEGRYLIPNTRIGGPYTITTSFIGYSTLSVDGVFLSLGVTANINLQLKSEDIGCRTCSRRHNLNWTAWSHDFNVTESNSWSHHNIGNLHLARKRGC